MTDIYFCYRFQACFLEVWGFKQTLSRLAGQDRIKLDAKDIPLGAHIDRYLTSSLASCHVMLVFIDRHRTRMQALASPDYQAKLQGDAARGKREIQIAMKLGKQVVPVLLNGKPALDEADDPEVLRLLAHLQPFALRSGTCPEQARQLLEGLRGNLGWTNRHHPMLENVFRAALFRPDLAPRVLADEEDLESSVLKFCHECIESEDGASHTATELYEAYCRWCHLNRREPLTLSFFARALVDFGLKRERIAGRIRYLNIRLIDPTEP